VELLKCQRQTKIAHRLIFVLRISCLRQTSSLREVIEMPTAVENHTQKIIKLSLAGEKKIIFNWDFNKKVNL